MPLPKIVDIEERRHEIMSAAAWVFGDQGYFDTTLFDIAKKCGMGRTSLYQYFRNKEDVFVFALTHVLDTLAADMRAAMQEKSSGEDRLQDIFRRLGSRFAAEQHLFMVVAEAKPLLKKGHEPLWQRIQSFREQTQRSFETLLSDAMQSGEFRTMDSRSMASTLYLLFESLVLHLAVTEDPQLGAHLANFDQFFTTLKVANRPDTSA